MTRLMNRRAPGETDPGTHLPGGLRHRVRTFVRSQGRAPIEVVPCGAVVFALVGEPERSLELYWLSATGQYRLRDLVRQRGLSTRVVQTLEDRLRWCHASHAGARRQPLSIGSRPVRLVSSAAYGGELRRVVSEVIG